MARRSPRHVPSRSQVRSHRVRLVTGQRGTERAPRVIGEVLLSVVVQLRQGDNGGTSFARRKLEFTARVHAFNVREIPNSDGVWFSVTQATPAAIEYLKTRCGTLHDDWISEIHSQATPLASKGTSTHLRETQPYRKPKAKPSKPRPAVPAMPTMMVPGVYVDPLGPK